METYVRTSSLRGYEALMRRLGADTASLLRRFNIASSALQDEDMLLPLRSVTRLLEASASVSGCLDFGLQLASTHDISVLGPLAVAMQNAPTVGDALGDASRYLSIQSAGLILSIHQRGSSADDLIEIRLDIQLPKQSLKRQLMDLSLADMHHMLKFLAGRHYLLRGISLPHSTLVPLRTYSRFYDAPVVSEQPYASLLVTASTLAARVAMVNESVHKLAVEYLAMHADAPDQSFSSMVRKSIRKTLGSDFANRPAVAEVLGLSPRTLQRRLADEGTSFDAIRDEVRKEAVLRYLSETRIPLPQVASLVGLSEQSALSRACHRWYGISPLQLRRQATFRVSGQLREAQS